MPVDAIGAATSQPWTSPRATTKPADGVDKDTFLKMLVAQLRNQDPSSPMDAGEMVTQTTQLVVAEKITALAEAAEAQKLPNLIQAGAALVGKTVTYTSAGTRQTGIVKSASTEGGVLSFTIDGSSVPATDIIGITTSPTT